MKFLVFISIVLFISFWSCIEENENLRRYSTIEYDLSNPDVIYSLPNELKEISGIAYEQDSLVLAIGDEEGILYSYDLKSRKIIQKITFAAPGDYEGLTLFQRDVFILRSDGVVFRYDNGETEMIKTEIDEDENTEAIAFDSVHHRLLVGSKSKGKIYSVSVNTSKKGAELFINLKKDKISISDMAIHPNTQDLYVLSDKKLTIMNSDGKLKEIIFLKSSLFHNPEGITFTKNGDIFISNEGNGHTANILFFKRNTAK